jgi:HPt (histidine-containing phosphotransfer) domain-containing protein
MDFQHIDPNVLKQYEEFGEDYEPFVRDLVETFLTDVENQIGHLHQAFEENEAQNVLRIAHTMKSTCAAVGATRLSQVFATIEKAARDNELKAQLQNVEATRVGAAAAAVELRQFTKSL